MTINALIEELVNKKPADYKVEVYSFVLDTPQTYYIEAYCRDIDANPNDFKCIGENYGKTLEEAIEQLLDGLADYPWEKDRD